MLRVAALLALAACGDNLEVFGEPASIDITFPSVANRKLDLLLQIDDSAAGGAEVQNALAQSLPALLEALSSVTGSLPDLHVGIITSDLGTLGSGDPAPGPSIGQIGNGGCVGSGKDGQLHTNGAPVTDAFLVDEDDRANGRRTNYQGTLLATLTTMIRGAGGGGCGFEQPLHATRRALGHPANQGFVRSDAHLAIVILSDEDDCSFSNPALVSSDPSVLGPLQSFRCTKEGVTCDQPLDEVGVKTGCRPRDDSAYVEGIELTRTFLSQLRPDPSSLTVAAIVGDPTPFEVDLHSPPGGGTAFAALAATCTPPMAPTSVHPGVRTAALVRSFDGRGAVTSVCSDDLAPQLREIGRLLKHPLGVICLDSSHLADSSTEVGVQPACKVAEIVDGVETAIRACPLEEDCFEVVADAAACPETTDHLRLVVRRSSMPAGGAYVRARCATAGL
ncbi:MAG: hypothetical protein JWP01_2261 [Myxococcales bacterium]|nr:hypothetical protein [Myxococcales bacterium]